MTREQLLEMPISTLRALDIKTIEDEQLVQAVLNEKLQHEPNNFNRITLPSEATDKMTPEKEKELQAKLDGTVTEITASETVAKTIEPTGTEVKAFCDFCTSKGVRHKKECTRLLDNDNKDV